MNTYVMQNVLGEGIASGYDGMIVAVAEDEAAAWRQLEEHEPEAAESARREKGQWQLLCPGKVITTWDQVPR